MIVMRDCIAATDETFPRGIIMPWPDDFDLPPGMIWLREKVLQAGPMGEPIFAWGDFTPEAKRIMEDLAR